MELDSIHKIYKIRDDKFNRTTHLITLVKDSNGNIMGVTVTYLEKNKELEIDGKDLIMILKTLSVEGDLDKLLEEVSKEIMT